jgi:hypothetical protein
MSKVSKQRQPGHEAEAVTVANSIGVTVRHNVGDSITTALIFIEALLIPLLPY